MTSGYKSYALVLMTVAYTINLIDRDLVSLLLEPIRVDLKLTDTHMGLVTGFAFGLFYAVAGLPLARWADRGDRRLIAAASMGMWGLTAVALAFVGSYFQLVAARIVAAVGEAGCKPPTYSLIGDYFPRPAERARAMAVYWLSNPLSALIGFVGGGWLANHFGWREIFLIVSIPGLLLAALVWFTLREPRHQTSQITDVLPGEPGCRRDAGSVQPQPPLRVALQAMWSNPPARNLVLGIVLFYLMAYGMQTWYAAFLMRSHAMRTQEIGLWLGLTQGGAGIVGIVLGGVVAGRWFVGNERAQLRMSGAMVVLLVPLLAGFLFAEGKYHALAFLIPYMIVLFFFFAPVYTLFQRLMPSTVRATTLAILMMLTHLISMGLGPQIVGMISDQLSPTMGTDSLRYAMFIVSGVALFSGYFFWKAGNSVQAALGSLERAEAGTIPLAAAAP